MKRGLIKKIIKITGWTVLTVLVIIAFALYYFTSPKTNSQIQEEFKDEAFQPILKYKQFKNNEVRVVHMQSSIDTLLPTLFFVHGSPGSSMDFKRYLKDSTLNKMSNIIAYDRVGYGMENRGDVLESLDEEVELLHQLLEGIKVSNVVLIGYSYGGTVVMASELEFKKKMILAASVRGDLEPMFWAMNFYHWRLTRPLVPSVFRGATIEKLRHVTELSNYDQKWSVSPSKVVAIHGSDDFIVPFENSLYLKEILEKDKFSLIPIEKGNHSLIWTNFDLIRTEIINSLKE